MRAHRGFLLPIVTVLLVAAAWLVADALRGATIDQALAAAARERQRAFEAAQYGLAHVETAVQEQREPQISVPLPFDAVSQAVVTNEIVGVDPLPLGFSAGSVVAQLLRVRSDGITSSGARVSLELGLTRLQPVP